ncbi:hypothetical protein C8R46DRAFT_957658 [Mycena filopes]|nr:hypothetical protein C8R46DRAFT_957658 [Mycena filopes]
MYEFCINDLTNSMLSAILSVNEHPLRRLANYAPSLPLLLLLRMILTCLLFLWKFLCLCTPMIYPFCALIIMDFVVD